MLMVGAACSIGCASSHMETSFDEAGLAAQTIRDAQAAGARECPAAADSLNRAEDAMTYAQHVPGDPEHARRLYMRALVDAQLAIVLTRREAQQRLEARRTAEMDAQ